jgi:type II secretory pathway component PulJ
MLLEVLVSIMLISVLCGVFALIMTQTMQAQRMQAHSFDRLQHSKALADQFRRDVARAKSAPEKLDQIEAGKQALILQMDGDDHVIYVWHANTLKRSSHSQGEAIVRGVPVPFGMTVEFIRPTADVKLVRLRLTPVVQEKELAGQSLEFAASLGGDWR